MSTWMRSEGPLRLWRVFHGRRTTYDGKIPEFSIQEVPTEFKNDVINFLTKYYIPEEPLCTSRRLVNDPLAVRDYQTLWRRLLHQGISIAAFKTPSDSDAKPTLAGVLSVKTTEDGARAKSILEFQCKNLKIMYEVMDKLVGEADVLKRCGVNKSFDGFSLSVDPSLRGQGIAEELIRAWWPIHAVEVGNRSYTFGLTERGVTWLPTSSAQTDQYIEKLFMEFIYLGMNVYVYLYCNKNG